MNGTEPFLPAPPPPRPPLPLGLAWPRGTLSAGAHPLAPRGERPCPECRVWLVSNTLALKGALLLADGVAGASLGAEATHVLRVQPRGTSSLASALCPHGARRVLLAPRLAGRLGVKPWPPRPQARSGPRAGTQAPHSCGFALGLWADASLTTRPLPETPWSCQRPLPPWAPSPAQHHPRARPRPLEPSTARSARPG